MTNILVPYDFSTQAANALRFALQFNEEQKRIVHILHVVEMISKPFLNIDEEVLDDLKIEVEKKILSRLEEEALNKFSAKLNNIRIQVVFGHISQTILKYADSHEMDLIVMGTKGVTGMRELLIGSNTEKIIRASKIPVIAVKNYVKPERIKNIVFPNTLLSDADEELILKVKALQHHFGAALHIVWVNTPTNFQRDVVTSEELKRFSKWFMFKDFTTNIFNDTNEEAGMINFTHLIKADMIALGTHGRKGLAHVLNGSLAEDLVNHADVPVWTYTIKERE
ncbi:universal stress protein [Fulvivirga sp. 29W222]|uniref:Universal stress protein n=1 Tax=Fulvivirga marina TaxID=2494733 RepID=A0A937KD45_9BACT|nr:universal stress protein [Fulvivirga marina]MBL6448771.1 universal stress protein [Fulvivirga marina]